MRLSDLYESPTSHYDPSAVYLHGSAQKLEGDRLKRYGKKGSDMGALFFCRDTPVGRWYTSTYARPLLSDKGMIYKVRLSTPVEQILDLTKPQHKAKLKAAMSPQEYEYVTAHTVSGHMDWAVFDEEQLEELGFRGVIFHERPKGMPTGYPPTHPMAFTTDHVLSVGIFHAEDAQIIGTISGDEMNDFFSGSSTLGESAPPGKKAARFIRKRKKDFQDRYGKAWKQVLYATAWKLFG